MSGETLVVLSQAEVQIISEGVQGPPGARGAPGASAAARTLTASLPVTARRFVAKTGLGSVAHASAATAAHALIVQGMSDQAANPTEQFNVLSSDEVQDASWNWDMQKPIWLGADGVPTQTPPTKATSAFCLIVGYPTSPTSMVIRIGMPIIFN